MICLSRSLVSRIHAYLEGTYPNEGSGLLFGRRSGDEDVIAWFSAINTGANVGLKDWFELDPQAMLWADTDARKAGLSMLGIVHSHPNHPARPSPRDLERAWPGFTYLICSVREGKAAEWTCWTVDEAKHEFAPVVVHLVDAPDGPAEVAQVYEARAPRPLPGIGMVK